MEVLLARFLALLPHLVRTRLKSFVSIASLVSQDLDADFSSWELCDDAMDKSTNSSEICDGNGQALMPDIRARQEPAQLAMHALYISLTHDLA